MTAARLYEYGQPLRIADVPVPEPEADEVLVRVAGAGICRSDLYVIDGELSEYVSLPVTMGHEIAGWVEGAGPRARSPQPDTAVAVMVGWGCGACQWCVTGHEQICPTGHEAGSTRDGGFADYVLVPNPRHLVLLGDLDPVRAAPLGDAGISSYAAIMRVRAYLWWLKTSAASCCPPAVPVVEAAKHRMRFEVTLPARLRSRARSVGRRATEREVGTGRVVLRDVLARSGDGSPARSCGDVAFPWSQLSGVIARHTAAHRRASAESPEASIYARETSLVWKSSHSGSVRSRGPSA